MGRAGIQEVVSMCDLEGSTASHNLQAALYWPKEILMDPMVSNENKAGTNFPQREN